jgi:hypothetical protein
MRGFREQALSNVIHGEGRCPMFLRVLCNPPDKMPLERGCACVWPSFMSMVVFSDCAGLGCFQHHPGERFMRCFIDRCIDEEGLRAFEVEELSGLISVSG